MSGQSDPPPPGVELTGGRLIQELIEWFIGDVLDELGTRKEVEYVYTILKEGSSADRQVKAYHAAGGDTKAVVDQLIAKTEEGVANANV